MQSLERLKLLTILTVADITAVGPGVWTAWKGTLVRTLYDETEVSLRGPFRDRARPTGSAWSRWACASSCPAGPRTSSTPTRRGTGRPTGSRWTARAAQERDVPARGAARRPHQRHRRGLDPVRGVTEITIYSPDHPRLLAIVTGACAAAGSNIVDAQIFTTTDGFALDTIFISRAFERDEDELRRTRRIAAAIERALKGEIRIADSSPTSTRDQRPRQDFPVPPDVTIDNALSSRETVVEVTGLDRPGLLYELTPLSAGCR